MPSPQSCTGIRGRDSSKLAALHTFPHRGFILWRLSDDGPGASRIAAIGRHPKPLYGAYRCQEQKLPILEPFCHVSRLHCGTATRLLSAARVTIIVAATYKRFLVFRFSFHRHESSRSPAILVRHDPRGSSPAGAEIAPQPCIRSIREDRAMMQSCASAAKLRGSGPNLHSGFRSHGFNVGSRYLGFIGRPSTGCQTACLVAPCNRS